MIFGRLPPITTLTEKSFVTAETTIITVLSPMDTPNRIVTPPPIHALSPIAVEAGAPID